MPSQYTIGRSTNTSSDHSKPGEEYLRPNDRNMINSVFNQLPKQYDGRGDGSALIEWVEFVTVTFVKLNALNAPMSLYFAYLLAATARTATIWLVKHGGQLRILSPLEMLSRFASHFMQQQWDNLRQKASVATFYEKFGRYLKYHKAYPRDDQRVINRFVNSLDSRIRKAMLARMLPKTLSETYQMATQLEAYVLPKNQLHMSSRRSAPSSSSSIHSGYRR